MDKYSIDYHEIKGEGEMNVNCAVSPRLIQSKIPWLKTKNSCPIKSVINQSPCRKNILTHLGFQKFTEPAQQNLQIWLEEKARKGILPKDLFHQAEKYLLANRILLPGPTV